MLDLTALPGAIGPHFWPLARLLGLFVSAPLLSEKIITKKVKIGLAVLITLLIAPGLEPVTTPFISVEGLWLIMVQLIIGVTVGLTLQLGFSAVRFAGLRLRGILLQRGDQFIQLRENGRVSINIENIAADVANFHFPAFGNLLADGGAAALIKNIIAALRFLEGRDIGLIAGENIIAAGIPHVGAGEQIVTQALQFLN